MTMKGFTGKTQKNWRSLHIPNIGKKKKLEEFQIPNLKKNSNRTVQFKYVI
jgi:hypothetical protein